MEKKDCSPELLHKLFFSPAQEKEAHETAKQFFQVFYKGPARNIPN